MKVTSLIILSLIFTINSHYSQNKFGFERNDSIIVKIVNDTLKMAWDGGLNYVQFSDIDYDYDGDKDLFVFDRSNDQVLLFENKLTGTTRSYLKVTNAHLLFPTGIRNRTALVDFNGDGKNDLFTYAPGSVRVYKNTGDISTGLTWTLYKNFLYTEYPGLTTFLYVSSSDIPSYIDVDNDGDLDILTFSQSGDRVEYHQNQSQELYATNDSLKFVLKNECWGKFREGAFDNTVTLNDNTVPCINGSVTNPLKKTESTAGGPMELKMHSGSTLLALDIDNSGVLDLVLGDVSATNMVLLINGGAAPNTNSQMISQDPNFPSNSIPINMDVYPAAFHVDVNYDGKRDLIVGANAKGISKDEKSVFYYQNTGTEASPIFTHKTNAFLQEEMIEHGNGSMPSFFDFDGDGLLDMLVANNYRYKPTQLKETALSLYKNTGTLTEPVFTFVTSNYLNLMSAGYGFRMTPAFGDIDGDGDQDMMLGTETGNVHLFTNSGGSGAPVNFSAPPLLNLTDASATIISTTSFASPQLFDLDKDGKLDLILGHKSGEVSYYKNTGTLTSYQFTLQNNLLGGIDISPLTPEGYAFPHFFRLLDTTYLFINGETGTLSFYDSIDNHIASGNFFHLRNSNFLNISVGSQACFTTNDIDNDGKIDLFMGQDLGGVSHYEVNPISNAQLDTKSFLNFEIYPNPSSGSITIQLEAFQPNCHLNIYSSDGKLLLHDYLTTNETDINLSHFEKGLYIVQLESTLGRVIKRLIKE
jgi:hypothetical protein